MITLPEFIENGMQYFQSNKLAQEKLAESELKVLELSKIVEASEGFAAQVAILKNQILEKDKTIETLENNAISAGRQAQQAVAAVGIEPVVVDQTSASSVAKTFSELVLDQIRIGKTKAAAVSFCIKNYQAEYILARENGGLSKI